MGKSFKVPERGPYRIFHALLCSVLCFTDAARADLYETEQDFVGDIDTVISATRIRQPLTESPSSITVIDRHMIEASGAIEFADVLRLVPGIQVSYAEGHKIAVTYHGFADAYPRSMQVLVDGRSVFQPSFAQVDWAFLGVALEDIERVEVIRGPNSPLYGANAVRGVINIITRQPYEDRGTFARVTAGDKGTRFGVLRHSGRAAELDYRLTLDYQENDGLDGNFDSTNDDRQTKGLSMRGIWNPKPRDEVDIQLGFRDGTLGAGAEPTENPPPHDKDVRSHYQFLKWRRTLDDAADISWQFYHNAYESDDLYRQLLSDALDTDPDTISFLLGPDRNVPGDGDDQVASFGAYDFEGERYDMEWQYISPRRGKWRSVLGAGARLNRFKSSTLTNEQDWIDEWSKRVFVNVEYRATPQLLFNLGAMAEDSNQFGSYISPRLAANWLFNSDHSIRASYARAKRSPSLLEGNFDYIFKLDDGTDYFIAFTEDDPGHETLTSWELGYIGYFLDRKLLVDVKAFREETDNLIENVRDLAGVQPLNVSAAKPFISTFISDGETVVKGGEIQLKYQAGPRDFIALAYSHLEADIDRLKSINPSVKRNDEKDKSPVPQHTVSILASRALPHNFEISAGLYRISGMEWLADGDDLDGYTRVDARLARRWKTGKSHMMLEAIVQNIGEDYHTFRPENTFDTRSYIRFSMDFQ